MRLRLHPAALVEFDEVVGYLEEQREGFGGHHPVLVPLALAHGQDATLGVDAVERQAAKLATADARGVQASSIARSRRPVLVRAGNGL